MTPADPGRDPWELLARSYAATQKKAVLESSTETKQPKPPTPRVARVSRSLMWRFLDLAGLTLWAYVFIKLFVFDVDRWLVQDAPPFLQSAVDLRVLVFLVLVALLGTFLWKRGTLLALLYVWFFPFVVLFWKIPRAIHQLRLYQSWVFWVVVLQTLVVALRNVRYFLTVSALGLASWIAIAVFQSPVVLVAAAVALLVLLFWTAARVVTANLRESWFLRSQRKALDFAASYTTKSVVDLRSDLDAKGPDELLDTTQMNQAVMSISLAVVTNRVLYLWATQLQRYQQSRLSVVLNFVTFVLMYAASVLVFALANLALFKVDSAQFEHENDPSPAGLLIYAAKTLALSEGGGLMARGDYAYGLQVVAGLFGPVFLGVFLVSVLLTLRGSREDVELNETVAELRARARDQDERFRVALRVGIDEAFDKLELIGYGGLKFLVELLRRAFPSGNDEESSRGIL